MVPLWVPLCNVVNQTHTHTHTHTHTPHPHTTTHHIAMDQFWDELNVLGELDELDELDERNEPCDIMDDMCGMFGPVTPVVHANGSKLWVPAPVGVTHADQVHMDHRVMMNKLDNIGSFQPVVPTPSPNPFEFTPSPTAPTPAPSPAPSPVPAPTPVASTAAPTPAALFDARMSRFRFGERAKHSWWATNLYGGAEIDLQQRKFMGLDILFDHFRTCTEDEFRQCFKLLHPRGNVENYIKEVDGQNVLGRGILARLIGELTTKKLASRRKVVVALGGPFTANPVEEDRDVQRSTLKRKYRKPFYRQMLRATSRRRLVSSDTVTAELTMEVRAGLM